ncbi:transcription elongation regulator 1-like protein isoform X2 [Mugil cephalus]|uniref:transcription elongation regulator 1-like protein isoform X2 n=1 Tax=Mugil cephalus TaxID=48193 RepID=UPI001FB7D091|nr:transcription elongation regulator 1-like protein isoform X2 [Mugil cephalus]
MMLPVSRFKCQPLITTPTPWLPINSDPAPQCLWLASWSAARYQSTPPLVLYSPTWWIPEYTHLVQWECPAVEVIPLLPPFYRSSPLHPHHPLPKLGEGWISPEEVDIFQRRDKPHLLTNHIIQRPDGHAHRSRLLLPPSLLSVPLVSVSPVHLSPCPPTGGTCCEWMGLHTEKEEWLINQPRQHQRGEWLRPILSHDRRESPPIQHYILGPVYPSQLYSTLDKWPAFPLDVMKEVQPSFWPPRFFSKYTLLTNFRHKKQGMRQGKVSYGGALLLRTKKMTDNNKQCVCVSMPRGEGEEEEEEEGSEEGRKDRRPVASAPVPGSPWCVVWTKDDQVFFFNPTIHLSVWERPEELMGRDISRIIEDPPHKRKKMCLAGRGSSCQSSGLHGNGHSEEDDNKHRSKKNRTEEPMSLVPHPGEVKLLPLELRIAHFREMMLERGVSAFSSWEKELHKMVFDSRYLLLTPDQRKQVFDQFVKSRLKDEYKEKKKKLQKAREEFQQLLEEAKITSRSTWKEFCARYRGDQRFNALNRKKEQEVLFTHYITSLKKRDKENRARLRKMR